MKPKVLIISFLIVALLGAFTKVNSQTSHVMLDSKPLHITGMMTSITSCGDSSFLLADETTLNYTKTEAKIECDNEKVFNELFKSHGTLFKRFTCTWKSDRYGRYKHYVVYLSKGDAEIIVNWAKTNL